MTVRRRSGFDGDQPIYRDRREAGKALAQELEPLLKGAPLVLALPRGGLPVALEVIRAHPVPMDIIIARKVGAPFNAELGVGAVAPGVVLIDDAALYALRIRRSEIEPIIEREKAEMERRIARYRSGAWAVGAHPDRIVIIDDGLATGMTARAATEAARNAWPDTTIIFAAPVCAEDTADLLRSIADDVVCPCEVEHLGGIGYWYGEFGKVSDEEVLACLEEARRLASGIVAE